MVAAATAAAAWAAWAVVWAAASAASASAAASASRTAAACGSLGFAIFRIGRNPEALHQALASWQGAVATRTTIMRVANVRAYRLDVPVVHLLVRALAVLGRVGLGRKAEHRLGRKAEQRKPDSRVSRHTLAAGSGEGGCVQQVGQATGPGRWTHPWV